ncbi:MAG: hypothetical protein A3J38_06390 [Gammaproteobacteria bacterium RIFCSPHIGHO2_12_FULL_45_9]|nr:MAG: hypothetical protein A3J38_06390 [Gammaproteobacteria bacterium RIFCSPHIGHO2_12_FULL_45_9]
MKFKQKRWIHIIVGIVLMCGSTHTAFAGASLSTATLPYVIHNNSGTIWTVTQLGMPGITSSNTNPSTILAPNETWSTTLAFQFKDTDNSYAGYQSNYNYPTPGLYTISLVSDTAHIMIWPLGSGWIVQEDALKEAQLPTIAGTITYVQASNHHTRQVSVLDCTQKDSSGQMVCGQIPAVTWGQMATTMHRNYGSTAAGIWWMSAGSSGADLSKPISTDLTIQNP